MDLAEIIGHKFPLAHSSYWALDGSKNEDIISFMEMPSSYGYKVMSGIFAHYADKGAVEFPTGTLWNDFDGSGGHVIVHATQSATNTLASSLIFADNTEMSGATETSQFYLWLGTATGDKLTIWTEVGYTAANAYILANFGANVSNEYFSSSPILTYNTSTKDWVYAAPTTTISGATGATYPPNIDAAEGETINLNANSFNVSNIPARFAGTTTVNETLIIGAPGLPLNDYAVQVNRTNSLTSGQVVGLNFFIANNPATASAVNIYGVYGGTSSRKDNTGGHISCYTQNRIEESNISLTSMVNYETSLESGGGVTNTSIIFQNFYHVQFTWTIPAINITSIYAFNADTAVTQTAYADNCYAFRASRYWNVYGSSDTVSFGIHMGARSALSEVSPMTDSAYDHGTAGAYWRVDYSNVQALKDISSRTSWVPTNSIYLASGTLYFWDGNTDATIQLA